MNGIYTPLFLTNQNWWNYKPVLAQYPARMSCLASIESSIQVKAVSLKYVYDGTENYTLGKQQISLKNNQFLIANRFTDCKVFINEHAASKGICIDFDENYLNDIIQCINQPNQIDDTATTHRFLTGSDLFSHALFAHGNMKRLLFWFAQQAQSNADIYHIQDFIKQLALEMVFSQEKIVKEYYRTSLATRTARKEIYTRLLKAKDIMHDTCTHELSVKDIAKQVCLSEFRFHHMFKKVFGITPHKYQTQLVMQKALQLHEKDGLPWVSIAQLTGFSDLSSFSKVFKKYYGESPRNFNQSL